MNIKKKKVKNVEYNKRYHAGHPVVTIKRYYFKEGITQSSIIYERRCFGSFKANDKNKIYYRRYLSICVVFGGVRQQFKCGRRAEKINREVSK